MGRVFFNTRENLDTDSITGTTTYVMTEADSGKTFMVSGGTQAVTLLPAASIGAGSAVISGSCQDAGNGVGCGTDGTAVSNIIIEAASQAGNWLEIMCDGSAYYFNASASQDSAFTTS